MINLRIYRMLCVPFAVAFVIVAFSLTDRPRPLSTTLPPVAFSASAAMGDLHYLLAHYPSRRPGSLGDNAMASYIASTFNSGSSDSPSTFQSVHTYTYSANTIAGSQTLENVVAVHPGVDSSSPQIVVVAHRDAAASGSPAELSATAALLELASVLQNTVTQRTLTLVSTSGGSGGDAGAAQLASELNGPVDAVIVLGNLVGSTPRRPYVVPWSDSRALAPLQLRRTIEAALQGQLGMSPGGDSLTEQLLHLVYPLTLGEQGPLLSAGLPAVLVQRSGELGPSANESLGSASAAQTQMQEFGGGVFSAISALDGGPDVPATPTDDLLVGSRVLPGWGLTLLILAAIFPVALSGIDILARVRRRREPVLRWFAWLGLNAMPFFVAGLFAMLLGLTGMLSEAPGEPVTIQELAPGHAGIAAMVGVAVVFALAWLGRGILRRRLHLSAPASGGGGPAAALVIVLSLLALACWLANPFTAALLVLPLHLWLFATLFDPPASRRIALVLVAVALVPLVLVAGLYAHLLGLGPEGFAWMGLLLLAGGHVNLFGLLAWSLAGGCLVATVVLVHGRASLRLPPAPVTVRGPLTYAGPGSLGGTDSAFRR